MSLAIDRRRHAMLEAMGIKHWARPAAGSGHAVATAAVLTPTPAKPAPPDAGAQAVAAVAVARQALQPKPDAPQPSFQPTPVQPLSGSIAQMDWPELRQTVAQCQACALCQGRKNTVFGAGKPQAHWLIVGEAPGENEDLQGLPFVGAAGGLLDNLLKAVGLSRDEQVADAQAAYIANVIKCRPPSNRNPEPAEIAQCQPFLQRQIELIQPKIIVALGRFAAQTLLQTNEPIGRLRGKVHRSAASAAPVVVSYHPAYLLRSPTEKAKAWEDWCLARSVLAASA
jgi:uracil-DNA glycosylase